MTQDQIKEELAKIAAKKEGILLAFDFSKYTLPVFVFKIEEAVGELEDQEFSLIRQLRVDRTPPPSLL